MDKERQEHISTADSQLLLKQLALGATMQQLSKFWGRTPGTLYHRYYNSLSGHEENRQYVQRTALQELGCIDLLETFPPDIPLSPSRYLAMSQAGLTPEEMLQATGLEFNGLNKYHNFLATRYDLPFTTSTDELARAAESVDGVNTKRFSMLELFTFINSAELSEPVDEFEHIVFEGIASGLLPDQIVMQSTGVVDIANLTREQWEILFQEHKKVENSIAKMSSSQKDLSYPQLIQIARAVTNKISFGVFKPEIYTNLKSYLPRPTKEILPGLNNYTERDVDWLIRLFEPYFHDGGVVASLKALGLRGSQLGSVTAEMLGCDDKEYKRITQKVYAFLKVRELPASLFEDFGNAVMSQAMYLYEPQYQQQQDKHILAQFVENNLSIFIAASYDRSGVSPEDLRQMTYEKLLHTIQRGSIKIKNITYLDKYVFTTARSILRTIHNGNRQLGSNYSDDFVTYSDLQRSTSNDSGNEGLIDILFQYTTDFESSLLMSRVYEIIDSLISPRREMYILRLQGYQYNEIAEILQVAEGTVKSNISRANQTIRQVLLDEDFLPDTLMYLLKNQQSSEKVNEDDSTLE